MEFNIRKDDSDSDYEEFELGKMSREEYDRSLTTKCIGCIEDQPNQLAHMDPGGCLYSSSEDEETEDEQWLCKHCFTVYGNWDGETSMCNYCILNEKNTNSDSSLEDPSYKPSLDIYSSCEDTDSESDYLTSSEDNDSNN